MILSARYVFFKYYFCKLRSAHKTVRKGKERYELIAPKRKIPIKHTASHHDVMKIFANRASFRIAGKGQIKIP